MTDKFIEKVCDAKHKAIDNIEKEHSEEIKTLHGRITAIYIGGFGIALAAIGALIMFILGKIKVFGG